MRRTFDTPMPSRPIRQKHGDPHTEDNYGFWRSLDTRDGVDINLRVVWHDPVYKDRAHGCILVCLHGETAASNGYRFIVRGDGKVHPMNPTELHRPLDHWAAAEVLRWRRGRTKKSAHPVTLRGALRYLRLHGGTGVLELKDRYFRYWWIAQQLVNVCHAEDHPPWTKALSNMAFAAEKCAAIREAQGDFALIFGTHVKGRAARVLTGKAVTLRWAVRPTAIW